MLYLLDTQVILWWSRKDKRLKPAIVKIISDPNNQIFQSVVSAWEISIKLKKKPDFKIHASIKTLFEISGFKTLDITLLHVLKLDELPTYHQDPFDRILIAQALVEGLTLITADNKILKYKLKAIKAK